MSPTLDPTPLTPVTSPCRAPRPLQSGGDYDADITRDMLFISTKAGFVDQPLVDKLIEVGTQHTALVMTLGPLQTAHVAGRAPTCLQYLSPRLQIAAAPPSLRMKEPPPSCHLPTRQAKSMTQQDVVSGHCMAPAYVKASLEQSLQRMNLETVRHHTAEPRRPLALRACTCGRCRQLVAIYCRCDHLPAHWVRYTASALWHNALLLPVVLCSVQLCNGSPRSPRWTCCTCTTRRRCSCRRWGGRASWHG